MTRPSSKVQGETRGPAAPATPQRVIAPAERAKVLEARRQRRADARTRILLVEDDDLLRMIFGVVLSEAGYEVASVFDGASATAELESDGRILDVLVTEHDLGASPDGCAIYNLARKYHPDCVVVYLTGGRSEGRSIRPAPGGVVLRKPFDVNRLAEVVAALLAGLAERRASA